MMKTPTNDDESSQKRVQDAGKNPATGRFYGEEDTIATHNPSAKNIAIMDELGIEKTNVQTWGGGSQQPGDKAVSTGNVSYTFSGFSPTRVSEYLAKQGVNNAGEHLSQEQVDAMRKANGEEIYAGTPHGLASAPGKRGEPMGRG